MAFLVLLYGDESTGAQPGTPEWDADMAGYLAFGDLAGERILGGEALHPTTTARTIRHDGGRVAVTDGPFAETVEALGGYYLLDVDTAADAIELARHLPASIGGFEVREQAVLLGAGEHATPEGTARHLATIHAPGVDGVVPGSPVWEAAAPAHLAFRERAGDALLGGGSLHPVSAATSFRVDGGEVVASTGPFDPAIAIVGGYYVLRGTDEGVVDLAAAIPVPEGAAVEVRPILELDEMEAEG